MTATKPRRVLLKLSGEVFGGGEIGLDPDVVAGVAKQVAAAMAEGVQVAIVVGGGTFFAAPVLQRAWTGPVRTTWACSAR